MRRCVAWLIVAVTAVSFGCGCSARAKPVETAIEVKPVAVVGPKLVRGQATVEEAGEAIAFIVELPPGWTWSGNQAESIFSDSRTTVLSLTVRQVPDDEKNERPRAAARRWLVELGDGKLSDDLDASDKVTIVDRRIIQIGAGDAVWDVVVFQAEGETQPTRLRARCYLKIGDKQFTIEGSYVDTREVRTAADFEQSQAELLKICESFRLEPR
jgi:hypothetical protein